MDNKSEVVVFKLDSEAIKSIIYEIRGQKVMLDFDLAKIYGYETKKFNQQVKRNSDKFPNDLMFQLTDFELNIILRSQNVPSRWGGSRYLPYAFTEQGIYMLMTVLKGDLATKQSIALVRAFKQMKDYIIENEGVSKIDNVLNLSNQVNNNTKAIKEINSKLEIVMDNFVDPKKYKHFLILDGCKFEADIAYQMIYSLANKSIYIIDDYISIKTLELLKGVKQNIEIILFSDNLARNGLTKSIVEDFKSETKLKIEFKKNNKRFHDRYIVIDFNTEEYTLYHCGSSSKDSGSSITTIIKIEEKDIYVPLICEIMESRKLFE